MEKTSTFQERFSELLGDGSVTDFADKLGISKQAVSAYRKGTRKPNRPTILHLATTLGVSPAWLIGYDVPKKMETDDNMLDFNDDQRWVMDAAKDRKASKQLRDIWKAIHGDEHNHF